MKGRLLSVSEVRQLKNGTKVWLEKCEGLDDSYNQESKVYIVGDEFNRLKPITQETGVNIYKDGIAIESGLVKVYEWIDEPKTYKGSEIIEMVEDGRLQDNDVVITDGVFYLVSDIKRGRNLSSMFFGMPFTIKQKPVSLRTALTSYREDGKTIQCELNGLISSIFDPSKKSTNTLINQYGRNATVDEMLKGEWYIVE